ncbi:MAG TPA: hypothetical protein VFG50_00275 [Rhodothermales bacterium]|nr:hypothetical protein [Rhodothermales bacterium]
MASIKGRKPDVDAVEGGGPDMIRHGKNPHPPRQPGDKHKNTKQQQMAGEPQGGGGGSKGGGGDKKG